MLRGTGSILLWLIIIIVINNWKLICHVRTVKDAVLHSWDLGFVRGTLACLK